MVLDDSDDDTGPGPGQYYNPEMSTAFMNRSKAISEGGVQMQFFGSTVERFTDARGLASKKN